MDVGVYMHYLSSRAAICGSRRIRKGSATYREGSSTYGIISLREPVKVALAEAKMIQQLGLTVETGVEFARDIQLAEFAREL